MPLARFQDADGWAPVSGFVDGLPVAADPAKNQAWIAHCYGVVGAARGNEPDSSNGTSLYTIIGQAPRALDLNITVVGRVVQGMEVLSSLPRGPGAMGFYEKPEQAIPITRARLLADIPVSEQPAIEVCHRRHLPVGQPPCRWTLGGAQRPAQQHLQSQRANAPDHGNATVLGPGFTPCD
ncbi:MAG: peptidylprolyl isomerase [Rhodoferax sp.]|nr:peptidylprolyl isomerase [Rhodoferax sp.]